MKEECTNAFCYCMQVGNLKKVGSQIMYLYELTREIGEEALSQAIKHLEGLTVFDEKLYNAVAKFKKLKLLLQAEFPATKVRNRTKTARKGSLTRLAHP